MASSGSMTNGEANPSTGENKHEAKSVYGVAIIGVGRIGIVHLKNMCSDRRVNILWLIDAQSTFPRLKDLLIEHRLDGQTALTTPDNLQQVFEDKRVDIVFICTPAPQHESLITAALTAGKHVLAEKPIALSSESAQRIYDLAGKQERLLFCAFNRRHDLQLKKIQAAIKRGDIGDLRMVKICSRDPPSQVNLDYLKLSGGIFLDSMIHDFDMAYWLSNEIPESVVAMGHAHGDTCAEADDVDSIGVMMKYKSGLVTILDNSRSAVYGYDQRVEVVGSKGMLVSSNPRQTQLEHWTEAGTTLDTPHFTFMDRYSDSYIHELQHFLAVLDGTAVYEDRCGTSACLSVKVALACGRSLKNGQVVSL